LIEAFLRQPQAFDGLCYHLPLIVRWLKEGQLSMMQGIWHYCLPANGELWLMLFASTGVECLIEPGMFPIGLLLALVLPAWLVNWAPPAALPPFAHFSFWQTLLYRYRCTVPMWTCSVLRSWSTRFIGYCDLDDEHGIGKQPSARSAWRA